MKYLVLLLTSLFSMLLFASPVYAVISRFDVGDANYIYHSDYKLLRITCKDNKIKTYGNVVAEFSHDDNKLTSEIFFSGGYKKKIYLPYKLIHDLSFTREEDEDGFIHYAQKSLYDRYDPHKDNYIGTKEYWEKKSVVETEKKGLVCVGKQMEEDFSTNFENPFKRKNAAQNKKESHFIWSATRKTRQIFIYRKKTKEGDYEGHATEPQTTIVLLEFERIAEINLKSKEHASCTCPSLLSLPDAKGFGYSFNKRFQVYNSEPLFPCCASHKEIKRTLKTLKRKRVVKKP